MSINITASLVITTTSVGTLSPEPQSTGRRSTFKNGRSVGGMVILVVQLSTSGCQDTGGGYIYEACSLARFSGFGLGSMVEVRSE